MEARVCHALDRAQCGICIVSERCEPDGRPAQRISSVSARTASNPQDDKRPASLLACRDTSLAEREIREWNPGLGSVEPCSLRNDVYRHDGSKPAGSLRSSVLKRRASWQTANQKWLAALWR